MNLYWCSWWTNKETLDWTSCGNFGFFNVIAARLQAFKPSSLYILLNTNFGIQLMVQLYPLMQVFLSADNMFKTKTSGMSPHYCVSVRTGPTPHCMPSLKCKKTYLTLFSFQVVLLLGLQSQRLLPKKSNYTSIKNSNWTLKLWSQCCNTEKKHPVVLISRQASLFTDLDDRMFNLHPLKSQV